MPAAAERSEVGADRLATVASGLVVVEVAGAGGGGAGARVDGMRGAAGDVFGEGRRRCFGVGGVVEVVGGERVVEQLVQHRGERLVAFVERTPQLVRQVVEPRRRRDCQDERLPMRASVGGR